MRDRDIKVGSDEPGNENVALELGVLERGVSTKRGTSQGVPVLEPILARFYIARKAQIGDDDFVFPAPLEKLRAAFREVLTIFGLAFLGSVHLLRHSFAMFYVWYLNWPVTPDLRDHGRWGADKSVQQYRKVHLLVQNEGGLTDEQRRRGLWLWEDPIRNMGIRWPLTLRLPAVTSDIPRMPPVEHPQPIQPSQPSPETIPSQVSPPAVYPPNEEGVAPPVYPDLGPPPGLPPPLPRSVQNHNVPVSGPGGATVGFVLP